MCNSINTQWLNSDQDVFIAAIILNPEHKTRPFAKSSWFSAAQVIVLICRLWLRFFLEPPPPGLITEVPAYLSGRGPYESMELLGSLEKGLSYMAYLVCGINCLVSKDL